MEKIKIVIVDDELTSRNTIKKYLEDSSVYEIIEDFQNGKTALEWMRKNSVDIVLCDMQMPEMNGVELMRNIHIIDEYLPVVAISGFDDFNYVRGSLVNGAANYLLKHELSKEHLIYVLDQVREQYRIVPKGKNIYRKKGYCIYEKDQFRAKEIRNLVRDEKIDFCCTNIVPIGISPDYKWRKDINYTEYKQDISKAVIDIISQILGENYPYIIYITQQYHLMVLVSFKNEKSRLLMLNTTSNIIGRIQRMAIRMLDTTLSVVCGEVKGTIENAMDDVEEMQNVLRDKFYLGENRIVYLAVTKKLIYEDTKIQDKYWEQLRFEMQNGMESSADTISDILNELEQSHCNRELVQRYCAQILQIMYEDEPAGEKMQEDIGQIEEYETFGQIWALIMNRLNTKNQTIKRQDKIQYSDNIAQVVEYIDQNYARDISLEKCAELVGCSYTSLSREFKKETGLRFVEYLNHQRVNKAKSLLIRKDVPVRKIVELAGFRNYNYFFKVFKEIEGVTPTEFATKK